MFPSNLLKIYLFNLSLLHFGFIIVYSVKLYHKNYYYSSYFPIKRNDNLCHIFFQIHVHMCVYVYINIYAAKSLQSCLTLCGPIDGSPPGSPIPGTLQARTLEWVAISFSSAWKWKVKVKSLSRLTLSDPMDCSPPGSSIHGIFQARVLEWGAIAFSDLYIYTYIFSIVWKTVENSHIAYDQPLVYEVPHVHRFNNFKSYSTVLFTILKNLYISG